MPQVQLSIFPAGATQVRSVLVRGVSAVLTPSTSVEGSGTVAGASCAGSDESICSDILSLGRFGEEVVHVAMGAWPLALAGSLSEARLAQAWTPAGD